jgi:hypothetical protein
MGRLFGLEADIAHLERLRATHDDDLFAVRRQLCDAEREIETATAASARSDRTSNGWFRHQAMHSQ